MKHDCSGIDIERLVVMICKLVILKNMNHKHARLSDVMITTYGVDEQCGGISCKRKK